jgi:hypothetical protein
MLAQNNATLLEIMDVLGHRQISVTKRYPTRRLMIDASAFDEAVLFIGQKAVHGSKQNDPA